MKYLRQVILLAGGLIITCSAPTEPLGQGSDGVQIALAGNAKAHLVSSGEYRIEVVIAAINIGEETLGSIVGHIYLFKRSRNGIEFLAEHKTEYISPSSAPYEWTPLKQGWSSVLSDSLYTLEQTEQLFGAVMYGGFCK